MSSRHLSDADLRALLEDLGAHLDEPEHRHLPVAIRARLYAEGGQAKRLLRGPRRRSRPPTASLALGLALAFILSVVLVFSPTTRRAVADWLGLRGVRIEQQGGPVPTSLGRRLSLGERVSLTEARQRVDVDMLLPPPSRFGQPDEVYVANAPSGGRVTLLYKPRPGLPAAAGSGVGLLLTEFRAQIQDEVIRKTFGTGTQLEQVTVDGAPGFWFHGRPHALAFADRNGQFFEDRSRLAGNTLLWEHGPLTLRLESELSKDEAIRVAQSLRSRH